jgi:hypothetical protein
MNCFFFINNLNWSTESNKANQFYSILFLINIIKPESNGTYNSFIYSDIFLFYKIIYFTNKKGVSLRVCMLAREKILSHTKVIGKGAVNASTIKNLHFYFFYFQSNDSSFTRR